MCSTPVSDTDRVSDLLRLKERVTDRVLTVSKSFVNSLLTYSLTIQV